MSLGTQKIDAELMVWMASKFVYKIIFLFDNINAWYFSEQSEVQSK
jgi:hypothetical protein